MAKPGIKSQRNQPELYGEKKRDTCLSLTKTAIELLDEAAEILVLSRSEIVEQIARRLIQMPEKATPSGNSEDLLDRNPGNSDGGSD